jgi:AraC-like DNA-binding protein
LRKLGEFLALRQRCVPRRSSDDSTPGPCTTTRPNAHRRPAGIESEILYRLLRSPLGPALRHWSLADSAAARIRTVARWICEHYAEPLGIDEIAEMARMSPATLHRHFKAATGMSPMKFQKHLRLQEARRRLFAGDVTAAQVAQAVGYVSATQFNREYRSAYGLPPGQDAAGLRARLTAAGQAPVLLDGSGARP